MEKAKILVIDDEPDIRELLLLSLSRMGFNALSAKDLAEAKHLIKSQTFSLALVDMKLPDGTGIDFLNYLKNENINCPTAMITAFGSIDNAVNALKAGAFDYVSKPINLENLKKIITAANRLNQQISINQGTGSPTIQAIIGQSPSMLIVKQTILKLARSEAPVYIYGESGVGKELVARQIHLSGGRSQGPFIPVNCGAISSELMESEFFGALKGSFTGAHKDREGLFRAANGGTLFLDEIAELPMAMQVKLLRAVQEKAVRPIGSSKEESVDVRILSASHKNLEKAVSDGTFRQDLYYRINVIEIKVPSLRQRQEDIPLLTEHILKKISVGLAPKVTNEAIARLKAYAFPGNIRELENILERAVALSDGSTIDEADLGLKTTKVTPKKNEGLDNALVEQEKAQILEALESCRWNKTKAAKVLGISFRALRYRLDKYNID